jgi:hypothetical protein
MPGAALALTRPVPLPVGAHSAGRTAHAIRTGPVARGADAAAVAVRRACATCGCARVARRAGAVARLRLPRPHWTWHAPRAVGGVSSVAHGALARIRGPSLRGSSARWAGRALLVVADASFVPALIARCSEPHVDHKPAGVSAGSRAARRQRTDSAWGCGSQGRTGARKVVLEVWQVVWRYR